MKPDFLNTILKEPDDFSKYVKVLINYRRRKLENCYLTTEEKILSLLCLLSFLHKVSQKFVLSIFTLISLLRISHQRIKACYVEYVTYHRYY